MQRLICVLAASCSLFLGSMTSAVAAEAAVDATAAKPALTIYHVEGRRSQRVIWLCEELGIPYELSFKRGDIAGSMAGIRAVNPKMPVAPTVRIGDTTMVESGAILEYLVQTHGNGKLAPAVSSPDYPHYLMWLHFAEGSAMPRMYSDVQRMRLKGEKAITPNVIPGSDQPLTGTLEVLNFAESHLASHPYFGGASFSAADIMMHIVAVAASNLPGVDMQQFPKLAAWRETVEARPAFVKASAAALPDGKAPDGMGIPGPQKKT